MRFPLGLSGKKRLLVALGVAVVGVALVPVFLHYGRASIRVPPVLRDPVVYLSDEQRAMKAVYLGAFPRLPDGGVQLALVNGSIREFSFDVRPLCTLSGLKVFAVDTDGKHHDARASQPSHHYHSTLQYGRMPAVKPGFEMAMLKPGQSFSWPVQVGHPVDTMCRDDGLQPRYTVSHYLATLDLKNHGEFTSNRFDPNRDSEHERRRPGGCPGKEFAHRMTTFHSYLAKDPGARFWTWLSFVQMRDEHLMSAEQFDRALSVALQDREPLIHVHASHFPSTWEWTLLDPDPRVRLAVLRQAGGPQAEWNPKLVPILLCKVQEGDLETRLLALKALTSHCGGVSTRQFTETIRKAKADPVPQVRETARKLFEHWKLPPE